MGQNSINLPDGYGALLRELKERIQNAQLKAAVAVNRELILLYWDLGARIIAQQSEEGWGTKVIDRLAGDLHSPKARIYFKFLADSPFIEGNALAVSAGIGLSSVIIC